MSWNLKTFALFCILASFAFAWYAERSRRPSLVGQWCYPVDSVADRNLDYSTVLSIRADNTFAKVHTFSNREFVFDGQYTANSNGTITFEVDRVKRMYPGQETQEFKVDQTWTFKFAVNHHGTLFLEKHPYTHRELEYSKILNRRIDDIIWESVFVKIRE